MVARKPNSNSLKQRKKENLLILVTEKVRGKMALGSFAPRLT